jgi:hypothetical protein
MHVMLATLASLVALCAAFSGSVQRLESLLWFVAFALSTFATTSVLSGISADTPPGTAHLAALTPFVLVFACGYALKQLQYSFDKELQQLKASRYRFKDL